MKCINHPEGYLQPDGAGGFEYVYQYKDHLGNVRLSYSDRNRDGYISDTPIFEADFESASGWESQGSPHGAAVDAYDDSFSHSGSYAARIDTPEGDAKYVHSNTWVAIDNNQTTAYTYSGWAYSDGPGIRVMLFMNTEEETDYYTALDVFSDYETTNEWVYFEKTVMVPSNIKRLNIRIEGFWMAPGHVWFDDIKIEQVGSEIVEENNYYPFGLKHKGYNNSINGQQNRFLTYNGVEFEEALGLTMYEMDFRQYDPAIARWVVQDPIVHFNYSPYQAFDNNPVFWADPSGADSTQGLIDDLWNRTPNDDLVHHYNNQGEETGTSDPSENSNNQTSENNSNNGNESCCENLWQRVKKWFRKKADQSSGWTEANTDLLDKRHEKILYVEGTDGYTYAIFENGEIYRIKLDRWERVDSFTLPAPPTVQEINAGKSIYSVVKNSPKLLKYARILGKNKSWSSQVNNLLNQLSKGNFNPGKGTKHLFNGVSELRSLGGARVYFRNTSKGVEILGYSNKANQQAVIKILRQLYGK